MLLQEGVYLLSSPKAALKSQTNLPPLHPPHVQKWSCEHAVVTNIPLHSFICRLWSILWTLTLLSGGCGSSCVTTVYSLSFVDAGKVGNKAWVNSGGGNPKRQNIHLYIRGDMFRRVLLFSLSLHFCNCHSLYVGMDTLILHCHYVLLAVLMHAPKNSRNL